MKRPNFANPRISREGRSRRGYTLVEILTATVLMIIIMMAVTIVFASVTDSIGQSRATLEMSQRLRSTAATLKQDLENVTVIMAPPRAPRANEGYFQYVEGPIGPIVDPADVAVNSDRLGEVDASGNLLDADTTVGDIDDILMFTAKSKGQPYVGLIGGQSAISETAEIIWFIRGNTLYRRVLLVKPQVDVRGVSPYGFYSQYDLSVRKGWDSGTVTTSTGAVQNRPVLKANSLADLTRPECRFAHHPDLRAWTAATPTTPPGSVSNTVMAAADSVRYASEGKILPHFLRPWLGAPLPGSNPPKWVPGLGLPILAESSTPYAESVAEPVGGPSSSWDPTQQSVPWVAGDALPSAHLFGTTGTFGLNRNVSNQVQFPALPLPVTPNAPYDAWANPYPWTNVNPITGAMDAYSPNATRIGDDVILTNVIGFDVKAWDPNAPIFSYSTGNPRNPTVVILPGEPGYIEQARLLQQNTQGSPSAFSSGSYMPPTGAYVDLNFMARVPRYTDASNSPMYYPDVAPTNAYHRTLALPHFHRQGNGASLAYGTWWRFAMGETQPFVTPPVYHPDYDPHVKQPYEYFPAVYDTWSTHFDYNRQAINYVSDNPSNTTRSPTFEYVGNENRDSVFDSGSNGLDDDNTNGVDDIGERETQPPYNVPLQGIQVSIRVFEPGSRQVREVTIIQKFRTK